MQQTKAARATVNRMQVPAIMRLALYAIVLVSAVTSVPAVGAYSPIPVGLLMDGWIAALAVVCIARGRIVAPMAVAVVIVYSLTRLFPALATEAPMSDFAQAYKWLLYLFAFVVAIGRQWGPIRPLIRVMFLLLIMALAKAGLTVATSGSGARSGLLTENNFEIALFVGLIIVTYRHMRGRERFFAVVLAGAVTVLSGSRSGAVAFVILAVFVVMTSTRLNLFFRYLLTLALPIAAWFAVSVFAERAESTGGTIDRLNFLEVFRNETAVWDPFTWMFGTVPLTPLSPNACGALSFYENLFASQGDGTCYSVVLHAFTMRVLFDAGIVGLLIAFGVTLFALRKGGVRWPLTITLLLVAISNGMSVSGLNNAYVALPILLAILTAQIPTPEEPAAKASMNRAASHRQRALSKHGRPIRAAA